MLLTTCVFTIQLFTKPYNAREYKLYVKLCIPNILFIIIVFTGITGTFNLKLHVSGMRTLRYTCHHQLACRHNGLVTGVASIG